MTPIQILPPQLVNRIAAGEVVERPASVIKELVENALDAGATRIDITASAGGRTLRVADNGEGMSAEDAKLAFYNHATSKLSLDSDLSRIETLGFRGEALASISSIARVTCYTRTALASHGTKVTFSEQGDPILTEAGCATGTIMEVHDLFYNTPARLKFLKRPQTEMGHIEEIVHLLALSHPEVQFSLNINDKLVLKTGGTGLLKSTLEEVFHLSAKEVQGLIDIKRADGDGLYTLAGYMSPPGIQKSSKRWMVPLVNGRSVRCPVMLKAIEAAYESLIPHDKYPLCVLFFTLPPEEVDVNVHPTKKEVRYAHGNEVFGFIRQTIRQTLEAQGFQTIIPTALPEHFSSSPSSISSGPMSSFSPAPYITRPTLGAGPSFVSGQAGRSSGEQHTQAAMALYQPVDGLTQTVEPTQPTWRVIGQLFYTYILLETRQGLMVVDQHIASERTFFEHLTQNTFAQEPDVQHLMGIQSMEVSPLQAGLLQESEEILAKVGFRYALDSGQDQVLLKAMPLIYQSRQPTDLFESLLKRLEETGEVKLELDNMIATLACHSAVRAGDPLTPYEMEEVVRRWLACKLPWTCPHGRPIAHTIATEELQHFFERQSLPVNA